MQMTIECPTDGQVTVDVSDVNAIVFDRAGRCEISFICPQCGRELRQTVTPVAMQMAIVDPDSEEASAEAEGSGDAAAEQTQGQPAVDQAAVEAYCEYFRRQLAEADDVEAVVEHFDEEG